MSTIHGTTLKGPWESALWGVIGLSATIAGGTRRARDIRMPTMQAWPLIGAGWLAMPVVGMPKSWFAYGALAMIGLLLTEYTEACAARKDSESSRSSRWRESGTWISFFVGGVGYHAYAVVVDHDTAAVKPLTCTLGLLALFAVKYLAHHIQRAIRWIDEIDVRLDQFRPCNRQPDPEPEPATQAARREALPSVIHLDEWRANKSKPKTGRHRKAA